MYHCDNLSYLALPIFSNKSKSCIRDLITTTTYRYQCILGEASFWAGWPPQRPKCCSSTAWPSYLPASPSHDLLFLQNGIQTPYFSLPKFFHQASRCLSAPFLTPHMRPFPLSPQAGNDCVTVSLFLEIFHVFSIVSFFSLVICGVAGVALGLGIAKVKRCDCCG